MKSGKLKTPAGTFAPILNQRANPCRRGAGGDVDYEMADMGFCVITEHMRADDALEFRIEMGKEVRMESSTQSKNRIS